MGLPFEAPSGGGFEDDSTPPRAYRFDDADASGYDGYSHDLASSGDYRDAIDEDGYEDDLDPDDLGDDGLGWDPDADGPGRM